MKPKPMPTESAAPAEWEDWMLEAAKELGRQRRHITGYQPVEEVARVIARFAPAPEEREPDSSSVMQDDMAELLRVLGLGDHARPRSPHEVMANEIIPAVRRLVPAPASPTVDHEFRGFTGRSYCYRKDATGELCSLPESAHPAAAPEPPAPASPTVADHPFQECWGEPHRPEWGPIDGCHSQVAFPCGQPRSAHPAAAPEPDYSWFRGKVDERLVKEFVKSEPPAPSPAPEPQSITEKYGYPSPMAWQAANYVAAPAPSVQPAACDCWPCANGHPEDCQGPEPAAQDRLDDKLGQMAHKISMRYMRTGSDADVELTRDIRAELERVVRDCAEAADVSADRESFDAVLAHWGLK